MLIDPMTASFVFGFALLFNGGKLGFGGWFITTFIVYLMADPAWQIIGGVAP